MNYEDQVYIVFGKSVLIYVDQVYIVFGKSAQKVAFEIRIESVPVESSTAFIAPPESVTKPSGRVVGARGLEGCGAPGAQAASRERWQAPLGRGP